VVAKLDETTALRARLEASLAAAEVEAYQQSAKGSTAIQNVMLGSQSLVTYRWLLVGLLLVVAGIGVCIMMVLRLRVSARK